MSEGPFVTQDEWYEHLQKDPKLAHGLWKYIKKYVPGFGYSKSEIDAFFEGESANKKQVDWARITSKPGTYPPSAHTHVKVDITDTPWAWADVSKAGSNLTDLATRQHAGLTDVTHSQHHNKTHSLVGVTHTAGGLTVGWVIKATGATTFAWGQLPHDKLAGLGDDDHAQYLLASGARALSAHWDAGSYQIRALKFYSDQATGTAPFTVLSTTMVTNLNADRLHNCVISGLTVGHVLKATAAAAIAFQANNLDGISDINLNKYKTEAAYDVLTRNSDGDWCAQEIETVVYKYPFKSYEIKWEFWTANPPAPWAYGPISGGAAVAVAATAHHPGSIRLNSGGAANSGYYWIAANNNLILSGKEQADFVFKTGPAWDNRMGRFGFQDSITIALPTDGTYLNLNGRNITGVTRKAGVQSTTGTSYNTSANTWYRGRIVVNSDASLVSFFLYDADGNLLWGDPPVTLSTNIPTAATGFGALGYYTVAAGGTHIFTMDLAYLVCARGLVR